MIKFKCDIIKRLKENGYGYYQLRHSYSPYDYLMDKLVRDTKDITLSELDILCALLKCHPEDLIEYNPDPNFKPPDVGCVRIMK